MNHLSDIMIMVVVVCAPILFVILFKHPDLRSINEIEVDIKYSPDRIGRFVLIGILSSIHMKHQ